MTLEKRKWFVGEVAHLVVTFTRSGQAENPEEVKLLVEPPDAPAFESTHISKVEDETGVWEGDIEFTDAGKWKWRWEGSGGLTAVDQGDFQVSAANVTIP